MFLNIFPPSLSNLCVSLKGGINSQANFKDTFGSLGIERMLLTSMRKQSGLLKALTLPWVQEVMVRSWPSKQVESCLHIGCVRALRCMCSFFCSQVTTSDVLAVFSARVQLDTELASPLWRCCSQHPGPAPFIYAAALPRSRPQFPAVPDNLGLLLSEPETVPASAV